MKVKHVAHKQHWSEKTGGRASAAKSLEPAIAGSEARTGTGKTGFGLLVLTAVALFVVKLVSAYASIWFGFMNASLAGVPAFVWFGYTVLFVAGFLLARELGKTQSLDYKKILLAGFSAALMLSVLDLLFPAIYALFPPVAVPPMPFPTGIYLEASFYASTLVMGTIVSGIFVCLGAFAGEWVAKRK